MRIIARAVPVLAPGMAVAPAALLCLLSNTAFLTCLGSEVRWLWVCKPHHKLAAGVHARLQLA